MSAERHIKRIYLSAEADFAVSDILSMYSGVVPTPLPPFSRLGAPVASHADMLMLPLDGRLYTYGEYLSRDPGLLLSRAHRISGSGTETCRASAYIDRCDSDVGTIRCGDMPGICRVALPEGDGLLGYPSDISLNALPLTTPRGRFLLCRSDMLAPELRRASEESGREVVDVRQGYTHCSVCTVADGRIITADRGIARRAEELGAEVLLISSGGIKLPPYDTGFIGGASVRVGSCLIFFGEPKKHPDGERILGFCREALQDGAELDGIPLREIAHTLGRLRDFGSAAVIY